MEHTIIQFLWNFLHIGLCSVYESMPLNLFWIWIFVILPLETWYKTFIPPKFAARSTFLKIYFIAIEIYYLSHEYEIASHCIASSYEIFSLNEHIKLSSTSLNSQTGI